LPWPRFGSDDSTESTCDRSRIACAPRVVAKPVAGVLSITNTCASPCVRAWA
jgi:hypothetical protein